MLFDFKINKRFLGAKKCNLNKILNECDLEFFEGEINIELFEPKTTTLKVFD